MEAARGALQEFLTAVITLMRDQYTLLLLDAGQGGCPEDLQRAVTCIGGAQAMITGPAFG